MLPDYSCETFFVYNAVHALHLEKAQSLMEELYQFPILFWNTYINRLNRQTITLSALIDKHGVLMLVSFSLFLSSDRTNCYSWRQNSIPGCFVLKV